MKMNMAPIVALAFLAIISALTPTNAVEYQATNNAGNSPGGARFDADIGLDYAKQVLADASSFIWTIFNQPNEGDRKNVPTITLTIESMSGVAYTIADSIHMSSEYIGSYSGDVKAEFTGVMYHETTHVWQWNGAGKTPSGLIEGVADYVRLKAGYAPSHWVKPGGGSRWDQGYDVTARFLDYCNGRKDGFVAELNAKMKDGYSDDYFMELLGESVDQLWSDYKAQYGG